MLCVILCVMLCVMLCGDVVCDGGECCGNVKCSFIIEIFNYEQNEMND